MVLGVELEHLQEYEVQMILAVLERDAEIQRKDENRRRKLQSLIRGERIPQKRLSIKCRTGEWMQEVSDPSRTGKKKGIEVVRASIRVKSSSKPRRTTPLIVTPAENEEKSADNEIDNGGDKDTADELRKKEDHYVEEAEENKDTNSRITATPDDATKPQRKTSFRRKKTSPNADKQVKFAPEKTEQYVYEQTKVDSPEVFVEEAAVPTIIIHDTIEDVAKEGYTETSAPEEEKQEEKYVDTKEKESPYDSAVFSSGTTFESYHNAVGKDLHKEETPERDLAGVPKSEKPEHPSPPKGMKKIKVVKRKGSTRRRVSPKITDDSTRNNFFGQEVADSDEKAREEGQDVLDSVAPAIAVVTTVSNEPEISKPTPVVNSESYEPEERPKYPEPELPKEPAYASPQETPPVTMEYVESPKDADKPVSTEPEYTPVTAESETSLLDEVVAAVINMPQPHGPKEPPTAAEEEPKYGKPAEQLPVDHAPTEPVEPPKESYKSSIVEELAQSGYEITTDKKTSQPDYPTDKLKSEDAVSYVIDADSKQDPIDTLPTYDAVTKEQEPTESPEPHTAVAVAKMDEYEREGASTPELGEGDDGTKGSPTADKPKKKVVKKVIKKKVPKAVDEGEKTPAKSEQQGGEEEGDEPPKNLSRLQRAQTVRKKVVRKKAPPKKTEE